MQVCESYPKHLLSLKSRMRLDRLMKNIADDAEIDLFFTESISHGRWYKIVEEYTSKTLTNMEDRLVALAGIAKQYAARKLKPDEQYWAGIWSSDIMPGMLWRTEGPAYRVSEWRAPSWSWASIEGKIETPLSGRETAQALISVSMPEIEYALDSNRFGAVKRASFYLQGRLLAMQVMKVASEYHLAYKGKEVARSRWWPDETAKIPSEILCLSFCIDRGHASKSGVRGLTLEKREGSNFYLRTGTFEISVDNEIVEDVYFLDAPFDGLIDLDPEEEDLIEIV